MARAVPIGSYEPRVPVEGGRGLVPTLSGVSPIGQGLGALGEATDQVVKSEAANFALRASADAESTWHAELLKRQREAQPGAAGFTPSLLKDFDTYAKSAAKGAPNILGQKLAQRQFQQLRSTLAQRAITFESGEAVRHNAEVAVQSIQSAGNEVLNDPSVYAQRLADRQSMIAQMNIDPETRSKLQQHAKDELSKFATMGAIERDPYTTMSELASGESPLPYVSSLSPEMRTQLMDHADRVLRERVADTERLDRIVDKQQEQQRQDVMKQGVTLAARGGLSAGWINQNSAVLHPDDLKYLYDALSGKDIKSDLHTYSDLLTRATGGEDVTSEANHALTVGLLSKEDFSKLVEISARDNMPNSYKRGSQYIKTALQVSQMNPDPAHSTSLANALEDWDEWSAANPKATAADAANQYMDIARRYQIIDATQSTLELQVPRYLKGTRAQPDIEATKKRTVDALQNQEIGQEDFNKQAELLQQWQRAIDILQQRKAAQAKEQK